MYESTEIMVLPQYYGAVIFLSQNFGVKVHFERNYMYFCALQLSDNGFFKIKKCIRYCNRYVHKYFVCLNAKIW